MQEFYEREILVKETEGKVSKRLSVEGRLAQILSTVAGRSKAGLGHPPILRSKEGPRACCEAREPRLVSKTALCFLEISLL